MWGGRTRRQRAKHRKTRAAKPAARAKALTQNDLRCRLTEHIDTGRSALRSGLNSVNTVVTDLISNAFKLALSNQKMVHKSWIGISHGIGSLLPDSLLVRSVQQAGTVDVLLRSIEHEKEPLVYEREKSDTEIQLEYHFQCILSQNWICSAYEIFRLLKSRELTDENAEFEALAHDLRLLRIPFEKHEIAADRKLSGPLKFQSIPPPLQEAKCYYYDPDDPMRGYDTLLGVAANSSVMWNTVDGTNGETKWLERLALSDRIISVLEPYSGSND